MQKVQFGGGIISPSVAAHIQKQTVTEKSAVDQPKQVAKVQFGGGGTISPAVRKHADATAQVQFGGGAISPSVAAHIQKQTVTEKSAVDQPKQVAKVQFGGGGVISPAAKKHADASAKVQFGGGGMIHPNAVKHVLAQ